MSDTPRGALQSRRLEIPHGIDPLAISGSGDGILQVIERGMAGATLHLRGNVLSITAPRESVDVIATLLEELIELAGEGQAIDQETVGKAVEILSKRAAGERSGAVSRTILSSGGRAVAAKTPGQQDYIDAIDDNTVVFGIGPAGTGKTYLAMAKAVSALQKGQVRRIVLTRPAVEAGEHLGYLPGSLTEKIDPYLRPLYDALHEMVEGEAITRLLESGAIEVAPLAYMRGRTLNDSFIILDEAQNTTAEQMKMFLTRLGFGSKMVVTGDVSQVDLPGGKKSGLRLAQDILRGVKDIHFSHLASADVVRHRLVADIIDAYGRWESDYER